MFTPKNLSTRKPANEEGFTLVELMVVILIIGILAAVAIPIFANQQKAATEASIKSDLKNAFLSMQTDATGNGGTFSNSLPEYAVVSPGNSLTLMDNADNIYADPKLENGNTGWTTGTNLATGTPPHGGNAILLEMRDHRPRAASLTVSPGDRIEITTTVRRISGDLSLQAGIWQEDRPQGCGPYLAYPTLSNQTVVATYPDGWVTYKRTITVPSEYKGEDCVNTTIPDKIQVSPFYQISQGHTSGIPLGATKWEISNINYKNLTELAREKPGSVDPVTGERKLDQYCIEARSESNPEMVYHISSTKTVPTEGGC